MPKVFLTKTKKNKLKSNQKLYKLKINIVWYTCRVESTSKRKTSCIV